jgi:hypothetical protein
MADTGIKINADSVSVDYQQSIENAQTQLRTNIEDAGLGAPTNLVDVKTRTEIIPADSFGNQQTYRTTLSATVATAEQIASGAVTVGQPDAVNPGGVIVSGIGGQNNIPTVVITGSPSPALKPSTPPPVKNQSNVFSQTVSNANLETDVPSQLKNRVKTENLLHNFKSYNYLFTLAAIEKGEIRVRETYTTSIKKYVIAKSSGKISTEIVPGDSPIAKNNTEIIDAFNRVSPGRFDLYFEDVSMENLLGFNSQSGFSKSTSIDFTIVEPYSLNGFIEALQTASIAAGYADFRSATYLFSLEFIGYPDDIISNGATSDPVNLNELGNRFFPIKITEIDISSSASGTRYMCKSIPVNELSFGKLNELPGSINVEGNTVGVILENFFKEINESVARQFSSAKISDKPNDVDVYTIKFPDTANSTTASEQKNPFIKSKVADVDRENTNYAFANPAEEADKANKRIKLDATTFNVQFRSGANIHDCVAAILRDCEFIQANFPKPVVDADQLITYFYVHIDVGYGLTYSERLNRYPMNITYNVIPYKIHVNRMPDFANKSGTVSKTFNENRICRRYNWIYTGKNRDIINFNLKLNTLYYQLQPVRLGTNDPLPPGNQSKVQPVAVRADGLNANTDPNARHRTEDEIAKSNGIDRVEIYVNSEMANGLQAAGQPTRPVDTNPKIAMAKNLHQALLSSVDTIEVELEIIGDPLFIVQGGIGNSRPKPWSDAQVSMTKTGEINHMEGDVYVTLEFKSPDDIDPNTGLLVGVAERSVTFSGVYRVFEITSKFSGGSFTQLLKLKRIPKLELPKDTDLVQGRTVSNPQSSSLYIVEDLGTALA